MSNIQADVVVIGSGFSGSICAMVLHQMGCKVVIVDRGQHPRFAIGESSTPAADFVLADLAKKYNLPQLLPLSQYGLLRDTYPDLSCGKKRGFSYFQHLAGQPFSQRLDTPNRHGNELLVAASADDYQCDSHWYRADVDSFLFDEAKQLGVVAFENTQITVQRDVPAWELQLRTEDSVVNLKANFLVDASGAGQFVPRHFGLSNLSHQLHTNTAGVYGHFRGVKAFHDVLNRGGVTTHHPYDCDEAAVHHIFDDAWMWNLRFDNGITSAGIVQSLATDSQVDQSTWDKTLAKYPTIRNMFAYSELVTLDRLNVTDRLQRLSSQIAGSNWAMLPTTAGFIDPLHSTGIAHALIGVERLGGIIVRNAEQISLTDELASYARTVDAELRMIDRLVSICYDSIGDFDRFVTSTMVYFAAVSTWEQRRRGGNGRRPSSPNDAFLLADDDEFVKACDSIQAFRKTSPTADEFRNAVRTAIAPFNTVGLLVPEVHNMYSHTAAR